LVSINLTNGAAEIFGSGESNVVYGIEAATNLTSPIFWLPLGSNTTDGSGAFHFSDTNAPAFPIRFYRAFAP
jgi:hypothetical protein